MALSETCATDRKQTGAYYTPPALVHSIIATILPRLAGSSSITILDLSCGDGAFLTGARHFLSNHSPLIEATLCGVDVDPRAIAACRRALGPAALIRRGNAILGPDFSLADESIPALAGPYLDWSKVFPAALSRGGFDAVIGNPPWIALAGRFAPAHVPAPVVEYLRSRYGGNARVPNLFEAFVAQGLNLTKPGGYLGLVVPDRLAFNRQYVELRARLLRETTLVALHYRVPFPGVTADAMILICRKTPPAPGHRVAIGDFDFRAESIPQQDLSADLGFGRGYGGKVRELLKKMEARSVPLGSLVRVASGFGGRSECFTACRASAGQVPAIKGTNVRRYAMNKPLWFDFCPGNLTGRTTDRAKLGATPKVLLRKTGDRLMATFDGSGVFPDQSLYFLFDPQPGIDLCWLLGVLNARVLTGYLRACCLTNPHSMAQVKMCDLERLPIPNSDERTRARLVGWVRLRLDGDESVEAKIDALVEDSFDLTPRERALACGLASASAR